MGNNDRIKDVIGIDLGGTAIKAGRIKNERMMAKEKCPTPTTSKAEVVTTAIIETVKKIIQPQTQAIGIGIPGVVDIEKGIVYDIMNIPSWKEVHLKAILESEFDIPVHVNNDANCFAIGEKIYGVGKEFQHFVGVTLGTGLGAGIIQNDRLLHDANCGSGEFCIVPYLDSDYEHYCSGMYFQKFGHSGQEFYKKAKEGDSTSLKVFNDFGFHIGQLVKLVMATIDPQMIVFGGSVAKTFPLFEAAMRMAINDFPYTNSVDKLEIRTSEKEDQAIFGAAALCY